MIKDYNKAVKNIRTELTKYLITSKLKSLILGVSGGIDSALTAAIAEPVCNNLKIPLITRSITISTNKEDEILRAKMIGETFSKDFKEVDLSKTFEYLCPEIIEDIEKEDENEINYKIRKGNIKARLRMIYLYESASKNKGMVLSTDNYTELLLGFWTLHGDVGDFGMLQNVWKTEVYEMARFLADKSENKFQKKALISCIKAVPTDGLGITNSDLDQIGANSYEEVDRVLINMLLNPKDTGLMNNKIVIRKLRSEFKRNNPYNIKRELITSEPLC